MSVVHWCAFILEFYCCFKFFLWLLLSLFKLVVIGVHFNCCNCCLETLFKIQIDSLSSNHFEICAKMATSCRVLLKIKRHFDCVFAAILQIWSLHWNHRFLLSKLFPFYCYSLRNFTILFVWNCLRKVLLPSNYGVFRCFCKVVCVLLPSLNQKICPWSVPRFGHFRPNLSFQLKVQSTCFQ